MNSTTELEGVASENDELESQVAETEPKVDPSQADSESGQESQDELHFEPKLEPKKEPESITHPLLRSLNREGQIKAMKLLDKVTSGDKTLEELESNVGTQWVVPFIRPIIDERNEQYQQNAEMFAIKEEVKQLREEKNREKAQKETEEANQLVREFRLSRGLKSSDDFHKTYPEFSKEFKNLEKKLGTKEAARLSLNTIVAQERGETNDELRANMRSPSGYGVTTKKTISLKQSTQSVGKGFGIKDEDYKKYSDEINSVQVGKSD